MRARRSTACGRSARGSRRRTRPTGRSASSRPTGASRGSRRSWASTASRRSGPTRPSSPAAPRGGRVSARGEPDRGGENERERLNRNLDQLLEELRIALPGVQVLFAFLLAVPFSARFNRTTDLQQDVSFGPLVLAALASLLLIAPSVHHRILFRQGDKEQLVLTANRLALAGLTCLALAFTGALLLVTDVI